ncbi:hypothetical protein DICPUDRAFT_98447 [Dictyostelium purpureum]|uniref:Uncharacterized protein n=1 Tax=Dictyostelium purpureum TaxID=5786 RepID=F0ZQF3_DICPU|nr:uncharacterized protein DICPUDRAFT_98447 [Dictyostelium purpureum]EGC33818.1 hypothetical protein DICPUDRAFT_98447 [Dictyostelium purpureum]|eukprot:XP_003289644.1 hypothetical protein DICPUDRAFT_98447 [Dictyostelium purpureum]
MSLQMVNPNFQNIDLSHYNNNTSNSTTTSATNSSSNQQGMITQPQQYNGMMLNQQQMQHVVPHLHHLQNNQLMRNVPDYNNSPHNTPSTSTMSPNCINIASSNKTTSSSSTNTPQITQASPANLTNSPSTISSPITISNNSSLNSPSTSSSPSLLNGASSKRIVITQQTCLVEEKFSKNGVQKNVHVVVKNNPFLLTLSLLDNSLNFHQLTPEVQLVYDSESLKEVDSATVKPLEYKTRANEEGDQLTIELRIKVLSSQLEDMLFRAKVKIVDPRTRKETQGLSVITHPIRVVSKPDQVKKKAKKRKRAPTDSLMDTLNRIEHQQKEQQRLLKKLCYHDKENNIIQLIQANKSKPCNNSNNTDNSNNIENSNSNSTEDLIKLENGTIIKTEIDSNSEDAGSNKQINGKDEFQNAFKEFIGAFKQLQCLDPDGADGAFKINTCANDAQTMCEILEMVKIELKKDENFKDKCGGNGGCDNPDNPCSCKSCPYKQKVDHINQSYENYFSMFNPNNNSVVPQVGQLEYTTYDQTQQTQQTSQSPNQLQQQQQQLQQQMQQQYMQQTMDQQQQQYYLQQYHMQQQQQRYLIQQQQQYLQQQQQQQVNQQQIPPQQHNNNNNSKLISKMVISLTLILV